MAKVKRDRTVRSVTLDNEIVRRALRVAKAYEIPPETRLSRIIDIALHSYAENRVGWERIKVKPNGRKVTK